MTKPAIEVKSLSKSYIINHKDRASYSTIKDDFTKLIKKPLDKSLRQGEEKFWALKDVSFSVEPGEIFGVIGRNGSGKSTLLKILSRIVQPTHGEVIMRGRVASLLEVGTGFHPELTGRENIFFNGSMLGMTKSEIERKFDEIVAFSEVEKFIDTPVKFYSSGMYVRLAFSVAAHLDPDILILDEVLAVGDAAFQEKSLKKIRSTMEGGTTVLFVSHSMGSVQQLCNKGILLNSGQIDYIGPVGELTARYSDMMRSITGQEPIEWQWKQNESYESNEYFNPTSIYLVDDKGKIITESSPNNKDKWIVIEADMLKPSDELTMGIAVSSDNRSLMFLSFPTDSKDNDYLNLKKGKVTLKARIPSHILNAGKYTISLIGGLHNKFWLFEPGTRTPSIEMSIDQGLSESDYWKVKRDGYLAPVLDWETYNG